MQTLQIEKAHALKAYNEADNATKKVLETLFGDATFSQNITDRIKTFQDALDLCPPSENVKKILVYNGQEPQMLSTQAHAKLSIIAQALNEGWTPDWNDRSQIKYWPWLQYAPGVGFSFGGDGYGGTGSTVGSRLCFKSSDLAKYAAIQFKDIYNDFFN